MQPRIDLCKH